MKIILRNFAAREPTYTIYLDASKVKEGSEFRVEMMQFPEPPPTHRKLMSVVIDENNHEIRWSANLRKKNKIWQLLIRYPIAWMPGISKIENGGIRQNV